MCSNLGVCAYDCLAVGPWWSRPVPSSKLRREQKKTQRSVVGLKAPSFRAVSTSGIPWQTKRICSCQVIFSFSATALNLYNSGTWDGVDGYWSSCPGKHSIIVLIEDDPDPDSLRRSETVRSTLYSPSTDTKLCVAPTSTYLIVSAVSAPAFSLCLHSFASAMATLSPWAPTPLHETTSANLRLWTTRAILSAAN